MELVIPTEKDLSYFDLMELQAGAFYYDQAEVRTWSLSPLLSITMPIRPEVIDFYTNLFETNRVRIERSFPRELPDTKHLPNIVELTAWWLAYLNLHDGYHGMRSMRTPSSTHFGDRVLCVYLMVNESLAVTAHDRRNTTVMRPDGTTRIIP